MRRASAPLELEEDESDDGMSRGERIAGGVVKDFRSMNHVSAGQYAISYNDDADEHGEIEIDEVCLQR